MISMKNNLKNSLKWKKLKILCLAFIIATSSMVSVPFFNQTLSVYASSLSNKEKKVYKKLLATDSFMKDAHKYNSVVPSKSIFTDETKFCMYDVMGDKRKELILPDFYTCTTGGFGMVYYYNSKKKKLSYICSPGSISEVGIKNRIMCYRFPYDPSGYGHYIEDRIYVIKNGKFISTGYCMKDKGEAGGGITYWKNGKKIKKAEFMSYVKKYKLKLCKTYKNTKKNRDKYIK